MKHASSIPPVKICASCGHRYSLAEWLDAPLVAERWELGGRIFEARNCTRDGSTLMRCDDG